MEIKEAATWTYVYRTQLTNRDSRAAQVARTHNRGRVAGDQVVEAGVEAVELEVEAKTFRVHLTQAEAGVPRREVDGDSRGG